MGGSLQMRGIAHESILQQLSIKEECKAVLGEHFDELLCAHMALSVWEYQLSEAISVEVIQVSFFISDHLLDIMF